MTQEEVVYREVDGFPGYRIGSDGSVWSRRTRLGVNTKAGERLKLEGKWTRLKPNKLRYGYRLVTLFADGKRHYRQLHRLILETFVGLCPDGLQCRHMDGDTNNNTLPNLCWGTPLENHADRRRHGTHPAGIRNGRSKLTESNVREIIRIYAAGGVSQFELANRFGVNQTTISGVVRRQKWGHIANEVLA